MSAVLATYPAQGQCFVPQGVLQDEFIELGAAQVPVGSSSPSSSRNLNATPFVEQSAYAWARPSYMSK